jgi:Uma2 family endonuclease
MTTASTQIPLANPQHIVLWDMSWDFYERLLEELDNRPIRVTFDEGNIEIMSPLPKHEWAKKAIASLLEQLTLELEIPLTRYGSTTFRREDKQKGLEPDECYYLTNLDRVRGMDEWDPDVHPAPDLAVEVDITTRSIPRLPIYAALGVPEVWRFDGAQLHIHRLISDQYQAVPRSEWFPFLPIDQFMRFVLRMRSEDQNTVLREFAQYVHGLKR